MRAKSKIRVWIDSLQPLNPPKPAADFSVENHDSLVLVALHTDAARCWISENVGGEIQYWGGKLVVEPRYLDDLVAGMEASGLTR